MAKEAERRVTKEVEFDASLKCKLTQEELMKEAEKMARAQIELSEKEAEFESMKKQFKSQIEAIECQRTVCATKINDKAEFRMIKCIRTFDWKNGEITEMRTDTAEIINRRKMTAAESQMEIQE